MDKNGTFIKKFGENGTAPGQLNNPYDLIFLPDGRLIVGDESYLNYFDSNGTFITRTNSSSARTYVSLAPDGSIWSYQRLRDSEGSQIVYQSTVNQNSRTAFTPEGDLIESGNNKLRLWKRAYRTKGLVNRNVIPQPAIRGVTQRAGTNIIDLDFEIIDPDDANATVGILAAQDGAFIRHLQVDSPPKLGGRNGFENRDPHRDQPGPPRILERQARLAGQHGHPQVRDHLS